MSFFGKVYTFERQENFEDLINTLGLTPEQAQGFINHHPDTTIEQNGDTYTLNSSSKLKTFKSGVPFEDNTADRKAQSTYTLNGSTLTQEQKFESGDVLTVTREFSDTGLIVSIQSSKSGGVVGRRFYKVK